MISEQYANIRAIKYLPKRYPRWLNSDEVSHQGTSLDTGHTSASEPQDYISEDFSPQFCQVQSVAASAGDSHACGNGDHAGQYDDLAVAEKFHVQNLASYEVEPLQNSKRPGVRGRRDRGLDPLSQRQTVRRRDSSNPAPQSPPSTAFEFSQPPEELLDIQTFSTSPFCQISGHIESPGASGFSSAPPSPASSDCDSGVSVTSLQGSPPSCQQVQSPAEQTPSGQTFKSRTAGASAGTTGHGDDNYTDTALPSQKRPNPEEGFSEDEYNSGGRKNAKRGDTRSYACPFYKRDPILHGQCVKFELRRIKDVKQHIMRNHCSPYCARCWRIFDDEDLRDQHARELPQCDKRDEVPEDWCNITGEQRTRLNRRQTRGLKPEEQWYQVWEVVCPRLPRPSSPYQLSHAQETISTLRLLWERQREGILSAVMTARSDAPGNTEGVLVDLMDEVFVRFERESQAAIRNEDEPSHGTVDPPTRTSSWEQQTSSYAESTVPEGYPGNDSFWRAFPELGAIDSTVFEFGDAFLSEVTYPEALDESSFGL